MASGARFTDSNGRAIQLGGLIGRGGEGSVYDINGHAEGVAKLYHVPADQDRAAKLRAMVRMADARLLRVAAWPTAVLHNSAHAIVGFVMPKVEGHRPVFQLYVPKLRLQNFPKADWRFLIHAATNAARAFAAVHAAGFVIGDVNHGNLVVASDGTVRLIDCDSFQITSSGRTWLCTVGVDTHQPPEMKGAKYDAIRRTPNHDNFGLAVILFQLLCIARHPFAGVPQSRGDSPQIAEAIGDSRYAYARDRTRTALAPPPGSLPVEELTPRLRDLFETAFHPSGGNGGRPTPDAWIAALQELGTELRPCTVNRGHYFRKASTGCPWCAIETVSGTALFPGIFVAGAGSTVGMLVLWPQVMALGEPRPLGPLPDPNQSGAQPSKAALAAGQTTARLQLAAQSAVVVACATAFAILLGGKGLLLAGAIAVTAMLTWRHAQAGPPDRWRQSHADAQARWNDLHAAWVSPLPGTLLTPERSRLFAIKAKYDALPSERARQLGILQEQMRQRQMEKFLDQFPIADFARRSIGVGPARVATLASFGIDTAGDIVEAAILKIPGFGPAITKRLLDWRREHERRFRFDPTKGVAAADVNKVERDIAIERQRLEAEVAIGLGRLRAASGAADTRRQTLEETVAQVVIEVAQATADANAVPEGAIGYRRLLALSAVTVLLALLFGLEGSGPSLRRPAPSAQAPASVVAPQPLPQAASQAGPAAPSPGRFVPIALPPPQPSVASTKPAEAAPSRQTVPESAAAVAPVAAIERVVPRQAANVRASPRDDAAILRTAAAGATLRVFSRNAGWVQIGEEAPWGWIYGSLLDPSR